MHRRRESQPNLCEREVKRIKPAPMLHGQDELKYITLEEFEDRVDLVYEDRNLSDDELTFVKKARRAIKNRDQARCSRQKKIQTANEMALKIYCLETELATLHRNYETLLSFVLNPQPSMGANAFVSPTPFEEQIDWLSSTDPLL